MGDLSNMTSMYGLTMADKLSAQQLIFNQQMQMIKGRPAENSAPASAPQTYQGSNIQDSLAVSSPSVFDLQNSPFANNGNMTQFFGNFYRNIQNKIMQTLAEYNQKIREQSQERINQPSSGAEGSQEAGMSNYGLTQADYNQAKTLTSNYNLYKIKGAFDQETNRASEVLEQMTQYINTSPERKEVIHSLMEPLRSEKLKMNRPFTAIEETARIIKSAQIIVDAKETTPLEKRMAINFLTHAYKAQSLGAEYNQKILEQRKAGINIQQSVNESKLIDPSSGKINWQKLNSLSQVWQSVSGQ